MSKPFPAVIKSFFLISLVLGAESFLFPIPGDIKSLSLEIGQSFRSEKYIPVNNIKESYPLVAVYMPNHESLQRSKAYVNEIKEATKRKKIKPSQVVFVFTAVTDSAAFSKITKEFADYPVYKTKENIYNYSSPTTVAYTAGNTLAWGEDRYTQKLLIQKVVKHLKESKDRNTLTDSDLTDVHDSVYRDRAVYKHPLLQIPDLSSLKSVTAVSADNKPTIAVYTFSGCKPCITLAKKLEKDCNKGTLDAKQILFINLIDKITPLLAHEIRNKYGIFPYYLMQSNAETFPYPTVVAYNKQGEREWIEYGYRAKTYKAIKKHLNK